jgi:hypothetical protein
MISYNFKRDHTWLYPWLMMNPYKTRNPAKPSLQVSIEQSGGPSTFREWANI